MHIRIHFHFWFQYATSSIPHEDEKGMIEGDILLTPAQKMLLRFRNMTPYKAHLWRNGVVPYKLDSWQHKLLWWNIDSSLKELSKATGGCVSFRKATDSDRDYVKVIKGDGCYSSLGRRKGGQVLSLGSGCDPDETIQHEFMHALGIMHEQSRPDRNNHLTIQWQNVEMGKCSQFSTWGKLPSYPYDSESVMHYGSHFFSCNGQPTLTFKDNKSIGKHRRKLTKLDVLKIRELYGCKN